MEIAPLNHIDEVPQLAHFIVSQIMHPTQEVLIGEKLLRDKVADVSLARKTAFSIHRQAKNCNDERQKILLRCLGQCVSCIHTPLHIKGINLYLCKLTKPF